MGRLWFSLYFSNGGRKSPENMNFNFNKEIIRYLKNKQTNNRTFAFSNCDITLLRLLEHYPDLLTGKQ